jgi:hypothetical protein
LPYAFVELAELAGEEKSGSRNSREIQMSRRNLSVGARRTDGVLLV